MVAAVFSDIRWNGVLFVFACLPVSTCVCGDREGESDSCEHATPKNLRRVEFPESTYVDRRFLP